MRIKHLISLTALFALALPNLGWGYTFITNNGTNVTWPAGTITMKIMVDNAVVLSDGTTRAGSIQAAMQTWNVVLGTVQFSSQIAGTGGGGDGNSVNEIFFSGTTYGKAWDSNTLAVTTDWLDTNTSRRLEADIIFNTSFTWDSYRGLLRTAEDIRRIALHELGHVLGLDHPDLATPPQSVAAIMNSIESNLEALQPDDIAGAQALYGAPNSIPSFYSQPASQTVVAGQNVSFSVGVSGSPVSVCRWQRQPAGSGTWSNLSDAGAYSGTGTTTLTIATVTIAMNGDKFRCTATNSIGLATSSQALLSVITLSGIISTKAGYYTSFSLKVDGTLWAAGDNGFGQLGDGSINNSIFEEQIASQVVAVAAGVNHSLYLKSDGTLWAMGDNTDGQLGDGTYTGHINPVQIASEVAAVAAGYYHTLFITTDGKLWATGENTFGQLGDGTTINRNRPVQIASGVIAVSAGGRHSLFTKADGTLWASGYNYYGQLGDGTANNARTSPVEIASGVVAMAAGGDFSLILKTDQTLWAMGSNNYGQIGDGIIYGSHNIPEKIASGVVSIAAGDAHTLFAKLDGTLWAAGHNDHGQLGAGNFGNDSYISPVQVATNVATIAAGISHSIFSKTNGTLWGMGDNTHGQLGNGQGSTAYFLPLQILGGSMTGPGLPTNLTVARDAIFNGTILSWRAAIGETSYEVWRNTSNNSSTATKIAGNVAISLFYDLSPLSGVNYYWIRSVNPVGASSFSGSASIVVTSVPTMITQPLNQAVTVSSSVTFAAMAYATPAPTYQWQKEGVDIPGATDSSYTIASVQLADAGSYTVVATNSFGSTTSAVATLGVAPARPATFDANAYLSRYPTLQTTLGGQLNSADLAWADYYLNGIAAGRSDGDFDPAAYLAQYPDLQAIYGNDLQAASLQWYQTGRLEGRRIPDGFDVHKYLSLNPDVAAVVGSDLYGAWQYYRDYGIYVGEVFDDDFRVSEYLGLYPELAAVFGTNLGGALMHWLSEGRIEGRLGRIPAAFDRLGYLARNPDVAAVVGNDPIMAWQHFWLYGIYEGRAFDDEFRAFEYLAINPDLTATYVNDWRGATLHWFRYGRTEGRLGRIPLIFSVNFYLTQYPDVAASWGTDPTTVFLHYWDYGVYEARYFDNTFRVDEYLAMNPDLQVLFGTDLRKAFMHWVRYGMSEGRKGRY